jgi:hypothetical protein
MTSVPWWHICTMTTYQYRDNTSVPSQHICTITKLLYCDNTSVPSQHISTVTTHLYHHNISVPSQHIYTITKQLYHHNISVPSQHICTMTTHLYHHKTPVPWQHICTITTYQYCDNTSVPSQNICTVTTHLITVFSLPEFLANKHNDCRSTPSVLTRFASRSLFAQNSRWLYSESDLRTATISKQNCGIHFASLKGCASGNVHTWSLASPHKLPQRPFWRDSSD